MNRIKYLKNYILMSDKDFFDAEATVNYYINNTPDDERIKTNDYNKLFLVAKEKFGLKNFDEETKSMNDYFYLLKNDDIAIATLIGVTAFFIAIELDKNGNKIANAIDKILPKGYDTNNAFDLKDGHGHRIFGHDLLGFAFDSIPANTAVKIDGKPTKLFEFLGVDKDKKVSMIDIIWKFYGNDLNKFEGIKSCLQHIAVHFAKDILTPTGLPLPFSSLISEYKYFENLDAYSLQYTDSVQKECDKLGLNIKASDVSTLAYIELFIELYGSFTKRKSDRKNYKHQMKLIAIGMCIILQMGKLVIGKELQEKKQGSDKIIEGAKLNFILSLAFIKISIQEMKEVVLQRKYINKNYDNLFSGETVS